MGGQKQARKPGQSGTQSTKPRQSGQASRNGQAQKQGQRQGQKQGQSQKQGQARQQGQASRGAQNGRANGDARVRAGAVAAGTAGQESAPGGFWRQFSPRAMGALPFSALVLSVLGVIPSAYLTYTHFAASTLAGCPDTGAINCELVTTSAESKLFGIFPVAVLGLLFFLFMVAINLPWAWRSPRREIHWLRLGSVIVGMIMVLWLIYSEVITLGAICLYCTSVHILTFLLFGVLVFQATSRNSPLTARR